MDGGQLDAPELTIQEAREQILEAHHMEKGRRLLQDYDAVMFNPFLDIEIFLSLLSTAYWTEYTIKFYYFWQNRRLSLTFFCIFSGFEPLSLDRMNDWR